MLFIFVLVLLFYIGPLEDIVDTPLPLIYVIYGATASKPVTNIMISLVAVIIFFALFNIFASVSRLVWAFARDQGLPFSTFFAYVGSMLFLLMNAMSLLTILIGASHAQAPRQRSSSGRLHRNLSVPNIYRFCNGLQRPHFSSSFGASYIILFPHTIHINPQAPRSTTAVRTLQARRVWDSHQHLRTLLPHLRRPLDAVPSDLASHEG
jgi:hypothetical protein